MNKISNHVSIYKKYILFDQNKNACTDEYDLEFPPNLKSILENALKKTHNDLNP